MLHERIGCLPVTKMGENTNSLLNLSAWKYRINERTSGVAQEI